MFDNLKKFDVEKTKSKQLDMVELSSGGKDPFLLVRPATEANRPYQAALLKRNAKRAARLQAGKAITPEMLAQSREEDRELYAKHVVTGWGNVCNDAGEDVPFSAEACTEFLTKLPNWIFDNVRVYCVNPANFVGDDMPTEGEVRETAGN